MGDNNKIPGLKKLFYIFAIRDLLIEKGIITAGEYRDAIKDKIINSKLDDETKQALLKET